MALISLSASVVGDEYICKSVSNAELSEDKPPSSYLEFGETKQWVVDSGKGWKPIFPSYAYGGLCEYKTSLIDKIDLLECSSILSTFVINLAGMTFAYTRIYLGNSVTFPNIESSVGTCERL